MLRDLVRHGFGAPVLGWCHTSCRNHLTLGSAGLSTDHGVYAAARSDRHILSLQPVEKPKYDPSRYFDSVRRNVCSSGRLICARCSISGCDV